MVSSVPVGAILFAWCMLMAVAPVRRPRQLAVLSWLCGAVPNELPFVSLFIVVVSIGPAIIAGRLPPGGWTALTLNLLATASLAVIVRRALRTGRTVHRALDEALGEQWPAEIDPMLRAGVRQRLPWLRVLLFPLPVRPHDVECIRNIRYGDKGSSNLLDVYRHRAQTTARPTLIHLHGGRFRWGRKSREARPLLHHLARHGWTCISANYQLSPTPAEGFPEHLIDVKRIIAWARTDGPAYGVDPAMIVLVGSSAGAHLTATAALTAGDPRFQPGFEAADTSVAAGIGLYGYYGPLGRDEHLASTPFAYVRAAAPPFLVVHGDNDTYTAAEDAHRFAMRLRAVSSSPVVYAELPGAQHSFDLTHSIRFEYVVDGIEAFATWVTTQRTAAEGVGVMS